MTVSNYISGWYNRKDDKVLVWERGADGRKLKRLPAPYYFYVPNDKGAYDSIYGYKLSKLEFDNSQEFEEACRQFQHKHESDYSPLDKVMMDVYYGRDKPTLHVTFVDIEVDYKSEIGFSSPENPYAPINAITLYHKWKKKYVTYAVAPVGWTKHDWTEDLLAYKDKLNLILCATEAELLNYVLSEIEDADLLSGWNSEFFDLPYLMKRTEMVLGERAITRWTFIGAPKPRWGTREVFGSERPIVKLTGRVHLDYMDLFKKFTYEGRASYALGAIAEEELGVPKLDYDGTLEELYNDDFTRFVVYNYRDVEIIAELDEKYMFIDLANQMAHDSCVNIEAVLGTVKMVETSITVYAHNKLNLIVKDKELKDASRKAEGAIVISTRPGVHKWMANTDINSLYPSAIRSLNMSPETIVGQFSNFEDDWKEIKNKTTKICRLVMEDGQAVEAPASQWYDEILPEAKWAISAFGTVFDQGQATGIFPAWLGHNYSERKRHQKLKKEASAKTKQLKSDLADAEDIKYWEKVTDDEDLLQLTIKILINSAYGALLNKFFRFFDFRLGSSTTACGRQITTEMVGVVGEVLRGERTILDKRVEYDKKGVAHTTYTTTDPNIITGDTDSVYFITGANNEKDAIEIADAVADAINDNYPSFMRRSFLVQPGYDDLIKAGRETVGESSLFVAKKKYVIKVVNLEGDKVDKLKIMGMEIKKSDTPKKVQDFLEDLVKIILDGKAYHEVEKFVLDGRNTLISGELAFSLGVSKTVKNLDKFTAEFEMYEKTGKKKVTLPGHVRAAINFNEMLKLEEPGAKKILSGDKIRVYNLNKNGYNYKSIAIPADLPRFPVWFSKHFTVDLGLTEEKMIDLKVEGIFRACGWEIPTFQGSHLNNILEF